MQWPEKKINVSSLDFDGCLANDKFHAILQARLEKELQAKIKNNMSDEDKANLECEIRHKVYADINLASHAIIEANPAMSVNLAHKVNLRETYDEAVIIVGSNRQDLSVEFQKCYNSGRCFPVIPAFQRYVNQLSKKVKFSLDKFLLGDQTKEQAGKTFRAGSKKAGLSKEESPAAYYLDDSKVTLLYAQMHRMASLNPDADITFDFYDDKENILNGLIKYFQDNPSLLPPRMKLRVYHYAGNGEQKIGKVKADVAAEHRFIDKNYLQSVKKMISCAGHDPEGYKNQFDMYPPEPRQEISKPGTFGVLNNLKNPVNTEKFKIERNLLNLNRYLDKEIKRLDHWYIWNGQYKADLLRNAKTSINNNAGEQEAYEDYKKLFNTHGLFTAINYNRHSISEKQKVRPESAYNYLRKFKA